MHVFSVPQAVKLISILICNIPTYGLPIKLTNLFVCLFHFNSDILMKNTFITGPQFFSPKFSEVSISNKFAGSRQQHHEGWPDEGVKVFLQAIRIVVQSLQAQPLSRRV